MGFTRAVGRAYARMFNFSGRAQRAEYWYFVLFQMLLGMGVGVWFASFMGRQATNDPTFLRMLDNPDQLDAYLSSMLAGYELPLLGAYLFLIVLPNLSLTVRRLHDTDRRGWNIFMPTVVGILSGIAGGVLAGVSAASGSAGGAMISIVVMIVPSLIASIVFLVWLCQAGTNGPNRFGDDDGIYRAPREPEHPAFGEQEDMVMGSRADVARKAAARDYYKRHVLTSIQKPQAEPDF